MRLEPALANADPVSGSLAPLAFAFAQARVLNQRWQMPTQSAEGLPRRRWSVAEIRAMTEAGIIDHDERFELIGGEAVPMNPKGIKHDASRARCCAVGTAPHLKASTCIPETSFYPVSKA